MVAPRHALLSRQLERDGLRVEEPPSAEAWTAFLARVASAYADADRDRDDLARCLSAELHQGRERAAEESVRTVEDPYRTLFDCSPIAMLLFDGDTFEFIEVNDKATELYGYSREELLSLHLYDLKLESDNRPMIANVLAMAVGKTYCGVNVHRRKGGEHLQVQVTARSVLVRGRRAVLTFMVDVTKNAQLEEQLRQAQKMEAIGQLAGGVAHDFNNILGVIMSDAELALEGMDRSHPSHDSISEIARATERAASLTKQLLTFSRRSADQQKTMILDSVIGNVTKMLGRMIGETVEIKMRLEATCAAVVADASQIEQVLLNLSVNARDAMSNGGVLSIETGVMTLDDESAAIIGLVAGDYVTLGVSDNGCGMDAATRERIFEPFFTTKDVGKGTGLGLATVFGIVQQSRGAITVSSTPGRGTCFIVFLPKVAMTVRSARPPTKARPVGTGETVLVVEDELQLRTVIGRVLRAQGYRVVEATGPTAALELMKKPENKVDLVLTDLVMPGMDGRTMAFEMLNLRPDTRVVYMSGYSEHGAMKGEPLSDDDAFIGKPFTPNALAATVRRVLDGRMKTDSVA